MKDKNAFLNMTARKTYEPELAVMRHTRTENRGIRI